LAALPLDAAVQAASESGVPLSAPENMAAEASETAQAFTDLAATLMRQV